MPDTRNTLFVMAAGAGFFLAMYQWVTTDSGGATLTRRAGNKPVARVKPKEPTACKLVGTVRGTKLWTGDCVGVELLKGTHTSPEQGTSVIPPGQKE